MTKSTIDFTKQTNADLKKALPIINREDYPQNYEACLAEIERRKKDGTWNDGVSPVVEKPKLVAGFWIRAFSDFLDMSILWVFAVLLSFILGGWFERLGESGVWVGLLISIAYFVPMQSELGGGQSLGKSLLGIQVLDMNGQTLTLAKSFLRYIVIAFVAYIGIFSGIVGLIVGSDFSLFAGMIMGTIWLVAFVGCYLLLPLHPLKRGLHDLIAGSVVVHKGKFDSAALATLNDPAKTKRAVVIAGLFSAVAVAIGIFSLLSITKNPELAKVQVIQSGLESTGSFRSISVSDKMGSDKAGTSRVFILEAYVPGPLSQSSEQLKPRYDQAFQAIREHIKDPSQYDEFRVGLRLGYDLGIRKRYTTIYQSEEPGKPGERKGAGSNLKY